jgi:ABC-2 type transport system ATP-binding protein
VFGLDPAATARGPPRCGIVSAKPALYDRLSGWTTCATPPSSTASAAATPPDARIARRPTASASSGALDQQVGGYSTGMKTRLALARSVLHEPELLLFDEPTSGLDPESSYAVLELIREMTDDGRTW